MNDDYTVFQQVAELVNGGDKPHLPGSPRADFEELASLMSDRHRSNELSWWAAAGTAFNRYGLHLPSGFLGRVWVQTPDPLSGPELVSGRYNGLNYNGPLDEPRFTALVLKLPPAPAAAAAELYLDVRPLWMLSEQVSHAANQETRNAMARVFAPAFKDYHRLNELQNLATCRL